MSEFSTNRISYTDIAKVSGYHRSTVGLALTKHPRIPEGTRLKILKVAEAMGYRPDPALGSLATYRRKKMSDRNYTTIALISDIEVDSDWKRNRHSIRDYYTGIRQRAEELGFRVEEFSLGNLDRRYEKQISRILKTRGIRAIIVCPLRNQEDPIHLDWEQYSVVCLGYSLPSPNLLRVCSQSRTGAFDAVMELYRLGYRNVGLVLGKMHDERVNYAWSSGFFGGCHHPDVEGMKYQTYMPKALVSLTTPELLEWIEVSGVDAIIVAQDDLYDFLLESGYSIPEDLGFACLDLPPERPELAGIDQLSIEVGRHAVDQVASLFMNNEVGIPENRLIYAVRGKWVEGKSVRQVNEAAGD